MTLASQIAKWVIVALYVLGILAVIGGVGRPRKPTTGGMAAGIVLLSGLQVAAIIVLWHTS